MSPVSAPDRFPTELFDEDGDKMVDIGREYGTNTGRRRRPGWVDAVMLRHAVRLNSLTDLAITKLDILDHLRHREDLHRLQASTVKTVTTLPYHQSRIHQAEPIYAEFEGWKTDLTQVTRSTTCRRRPRAFLDALAEQAGVPISLVSTGPGRKQYLRY